MPHVNPDLPVDGETADAGDISIPFALLLAIFNGHIAGDNIEPGSLPWSVMDDFAEAIPSSAMKDSANLEKFRAEAGIGFIAEGLTWSDLGGFIGSMAEGVYYSPTTGERIDIPTVESRTFTASKDTYISISPTGSLRYDEVANNATPPSLLTNYVWVARFVTNGTEITKVDDIRQTKPFANQEAWTQLTLANGWTSFSDSEFEQNLFIKKDTNGLVTIKGIVNGASATSDIVVPLGGLPLGYRPPRTVIYPALAVDLPVRFDVKTDGSIRYQKLSTLSGNTSTPIWLSLAGSWYGEV